MDAEVGARAFGVTFASIGIGFRSGLPKAKDEFPLRRKRSSPSRFCLSRSKASFDITLGYIELPEVIFLAGDQANGQQWSGGELYLNIGSRASVRSSCGRRDQ